MSADDASAMNAAAPKDAQMATWFYSIVTSKIFILNCLFSWAWILYAKKSIKPLVQKNEEHINRDKKFSAFRRNDLNILFKS